MEKQKLLEKVEGFVVVLRNLLYILAIIYPIFGIIAGIVLQSKKFGAEIKTIGRICFWFSILVIVIFGFIVLVLF